MTTGSLLTQGTVPGAVADLGLSGNRFPLTITRIVGIPDGNLNAEAGSQIAFDGANGQFYMAESAGTDWINLGSVSA